MLNKIKLFLALLLVFTMSACSSPKTLEEYVNSQPKLQEQIKKDCESNDIFEISVITKDNTISYNYKYKMQFDKEKAELIKKQIQEEAPEFKEQMSTKATELEKESNIEGITVEINFFNADGSSLFKGIYKANK